jgi:ferredoxin
MTIPAEKKVIILSEEKKKLLKSAGKRFPKVNDTCIGCNACVVVSEWVFELDDESWKSFTIELDDYEGKWVENAISACPVDSISWEA